jgi:hypothetical protein
MVQASPKDAEKKETTYLATKLHKGTQRKNICITFTVSVMFFMRRFPGCDQKNLAEKTRN